MIISVGSIKSKLVSHKKKKLSEKHETQISIILGVNVSHVHDLNLTKQDKQHHQHLSS